MTSLSAAPMPAMGSSSSNSLGASAKAVDVSPQAQLARLSKTEEKDDRLVSVSTDAEANAAACGAESETACLRIQPVASND